MQKAYQKSEHEIYLENEAGERIAEILFPEVEPKVYCIQRTFVDDSLRGQGVAGTLMELAVQAIQEQGCSGADGFLFVASFAGFISLCNGLAFRNFSNDRPIAMDFLVIFFPVFRDDDGLTAAVCVWGNRWGLRWNFCCRGQRGCNCGGWLWLFCGDGCRFCCRW